MLVENYSNSPGGQTYSAATRIFIGLRANISSKCDSSFEFVYAPMVLAFGILIGAWQVLSPTAILRRIYPIPSELGSQAAKGPVSTGVGDRPGSP